MEGTGFTLRDEVSEMGSETRPSPPHSSLSLGSFTRPLSLTQLLPLSLVSLGRNGNGTEPQVKVK